MAGYIEKIGYFARQAARRLVAGFQTWPQGAGNGTARLYALPADVYPTDRVASGLRAGPQNRRLMWGKDYAPSRWWPNYPAERRQVLEIFCANSKTEHANQGEICDLFFSIM